ncbi:ABC transporter permease [Bifidobacterium platyrrhinorum]|nr:ABC transporter permease [Bifidobacterium platyrrhinorum]
MRHATPGAATPDAATAAPQSRNEGMLRRAIMNEYAKMHRLKVLPLYILMPVGIIGATMFESLGAGLTRHLTDTDGTAWKLVTACMGAGFSMLMPILLAVIASRQADIEHLGNGWLFQSTAGLAPGRLCRIKFIATGLPVILVSLLAVMVTTGFALAVGVTGPVPWLRLAGYAVAVTTVSLIVLAVQLLIASRVENQLAGIGIGLIGFLLANFAGAFPDWLAYPTLWGAYAKIMPAGYQGESLVWNDTSYAAVGVLAVIAAVMFLWITARFDRMEARS